MNRTIIVAAVVVLLIIIVVSKELTQAKKKRAATQASCSVLNIQTDRSGQSILCPPNLSGRSWSTRGLGNYGIHDAADCSSASNYKDCNRCVAQSAGAPGGYQADPSIGFDAAEWPTRNSIWGPYAGPTANGQFTIYQGDQTVADSAPAPAACLG